MSIQSTKKEKYTLVTVDIEKLDGTKSPELKSQFVLLNNEGNKNIILDFSTVKYSDSSGLSAILVAKRLCENLGGTFVIFGLQEYVSKLITISQLDSILNITPTLKEAEELVYMEEIQGNLN